MAHVEGKTTPGPVPKMTYMKTLMIIIAIAALAACRQEGPAEKAGRNLDNAAAKTAKGIENAGDKVRDAVNGKK